MASVKHGQPYLGQAWPCFSKAWPGLSLPRGQALPLGFTACFIYSQFYIFPVLFILSFIYFMLFMFYARLSLRALGLLFYIIYVLCRFPLR